jgi:hypothetical protein
MAGVMFRASVPGGEEGKVRFPCAEWRGSSFNVVVSEIDGSNFPGQIVEALDFLEARSSVIAALLCQPGAQGSLDFGLWKTDGPSHSVRIPAKLLQAAGALGLEVEVSLYAVDD